MTLRDHRRFSDRLAFTLNNRIRRLLSPPEQLISELDVRADDVVVDFGCGPGFLTISLAKVAGKVIGIDVSQRMLEKAASYASKSKVAVEFVRSDGTEIKLADKSVDIVLLNYVFHEVEDRPRVLGEFLRILKPSARLAIVERTGGGILPGRLGAPIINEAEILLELERAGFAHKRTIPHEKASIMIADKIASVSKL